MGADIHAFIEHRYTKEGSWFLYSEALLGRNYELFGLLAGVRGTNDPIIEPKGLPVDLSIELLPHFVYRITSNPKVKEILNNNKNQDYKAAIVPIDYNDIKYEYKEEIKEPQGQFYEHKEVQLGDTGDRLIIYDYHNYSWLTLTELTKVNTAYKKETGEICGNLEALLFTMHWLADDESEVRLTFWFDS